MLKFLILITSCNIIFATVSNNNGETQKFQNKNPQSLAVNSEIQEFNPGITRSHENDTESSEISSDEFESAQTTFSDNDDSEIQLIEPNTALDSSYEDVDWPLILENKDTYTYLCPPETQNDKKIRRELSIKLKHVQYCLFEKPFGPTDKKICQDEVKPILYSIQKRKKELKCSKSKLYSFAFLNCLSLDNLREKYRNHKKQKHFTIKTAIMYDICYDNSKNTVFWTKHFISFRKQLLEKYNKLDPRTKEKYIDMQYFGRKSKDEEHLDKISANTYDLKELKGTLFEAMKVAFKQEKGKKENRIIPHMLVPPEDLLVPLWMSTTNHMINVAPLAENLVPLMNAINNGIRNAAIMAKEKDNSHVLEIYTRAFLKKKKSSLWSKFKITKTTTSTPEAFLNDDKRFPIPSIWSKFVYCETTKLGIMIFVHNALNKVAQKDEEYCTDKDRIKCNFSEWSEEGEKIKGNVKQLSIYAYCCKATVSLIKQIFQIKKTINGDLDIEKILRDNG